jgi:CheY-like chemotaxis protein
VLLQVWDTGCGIAENDIGKIFDEFYQVGNPQRNREAGLGLGLSICQRAMALLGGEIGCRSTLGRGSVFELSIPIDQEQLPIEHFSVQHELDSKPDKRLFKNKRVVVLEDDQLVAEGMINLLQGLGAHVLHFQNAEVALLHEGTVEADYFVVDYALERELTGAAFLRAVQSKTAKPIKGVIVTGETSSRFIEGIADLPWPVLHKPISFHQLAGALKS